MTEVTPNLPHFGSFCKYCFMGTLLLLAISNRAAYNLCNTTKDFKVIRLGTSIRVSKQSFDDWFAAV